MTANATRIVTQWPQSSNETLTDVYVYGKHVCFGVKTSQNDGVACVALELSWSDAPLQQTRDLFTWFDSSHFQKIKLKF